MHGKADDTDGAQPVQDALMDMLASIMRPLVTLRNVRCRLTPSL